MDEEANDSLRCSWNRDSTKCREEEQINSLLGLPSSQSGAGLGGGGYKLGLLVQLRKIT